MVRVDEIRDFGTLKQAAQLLETAVSKLQSENAKLKLEIALRDGKARAVEQTTILEEELAKLKAAHFGASSEKRPHKGGDESSKDGEDKKAKGQEGHGPTPQPRLPIEETTYEIDAGDEICPDCGEPRKTKDGLTQESEIITVVGVEFKLEKVTQLIYGCSCPEALFTAPGPDRVIPGGRYSLEFAAFCAAQKYLDHMPLARQQRMMDRKGLEITRSAIWDQIEALARYLEPTWQAIHDYALGADWVQCDETRWPMLGGPGSIKWWTWCVATDDAVYYDIHTHRSAKAAKAMLKDFSGVVVSDGYSAYDKAIGKNSKIQRAHCWAHVRRKFLEAEASYPEEVKKPIKWIQELFMIERQVPKLARGAPLAEREKVFEIRKKLRKEKSQQIIDNLRDWAYDILPALLPSTGLAKAVNYMLNLWPGLILFLKDPKVPLDNNAAERALRGPVVGRKNHYGSKTKRGTVVAAIFYSLFESAKLAGVDPEAYVLEAARRAARCAGTVTLPADLVS